MRKYGIESGNNDTKSGILTTYGIIPCNSNPLSSAQKTPNHFCGWVFFGIGFGIRTHPNATPRWGVACRLREQCVSRRRIFAFRQKTNSCCLPWTHLLQKRLPEVDKKLQNVKTETKKCDTRRFCRLFSS